MKTVQGEFATRHLAQRAVQALKVAGVPADHIRIWNVIPEGKPVAPRNGDAATDVSLDSAGSEQPNLPFPSGVRIVVDISPSGPELAEILRDTGAANVA